MEQQELPPEMLEAQKLQATKMPHALFVVDQILKIRADSEQMQVTLGWRSPGDMISPVVTLHMPASFADQLAKAILAKK